MSCGDPKTGRNIFPLCEITYNSHPIFDEDSEEGSEENDDHAEVGGDDEDTDQGSEENHDDAEVGSDKQNTDEGSEENDDDAEAGGDDEDSDQGSHIKKE